MKSRFLFYWALKQPGRILFQLHTVYTIHSFSIQWWFIKNIYSFQLYSTRALRCAVSLYILWQLLIYAKLMTRHLGFFSMAATAPAPAAVARTRMKSIKLTLYINANIFQKLKWIRRWWWWLKVADDQQRQKKKTENNFRICIIILWRFMRARSMLRKGLTIKFNEQNVFWKEMKGHHLLGGTNGSGDINFVCCKCQI